MAHTFPSIRRRDLLIGTGVLTGSAVLPTFSATEPSIQAAVNIGRESKAISPRIYGGFLEHIGNLINHSLWSEVLDDRKFFYGVLEKPEPKPTDPRSAMRYIHKWVAVGPFDAIKMDKKNAYVGGHSPQVTVARSKPRGFAQHELALAGGKAYNGRIVLAADASVKVTATLIWGTGKNARQSVQLDSSQAWQTLPLAFNVGADTTSGRLEITGQGKGTFHVGALSLMPADNVEGFRADTIALMRDMNCHIMRMPGGNFVSAYDWKDTIGDPDKRPPIMDPVWSAVQPNDVGVDELLRMCELIECEPYWCVNTGYGEPRSGAECLEYVNGAVSTEWGAKRAANGRAKPYQVKYWAIGNEMYGHWQAGHMSRDHYTQKHNLFVDAMRKVDPSIYIVAPGGFVDEMTTGQGIFIEGQPQVKVGSERDWAYGMFKDSWGKFDALGTHAYPPENKRFNLKTGKLFDVEQTLLEWARQPANRIRTMVDAWEEYKKQFPKLEEGSVKVFFDEWAYHFQDDFKGTLAIALAFHEFFRHTDFIDMAGYTMATGWLDFNRTDATISTRGRLFQFYQQHFGSIPVAVTGDASQPAPQHPVGGDQPRVNSGSETYPLDVSAALSADRKTLTLAVVNATESSHNLKLDINARKSAALGRSWLFTAGSLDARNQVGQPPAVVVKEAAFETSDAHLVIGPTSVAIYHYPLV